jgi:hypothetical protein
LNEAVYLAGTKGITIKTLEESVNWIMNDKNISYLLASDFSYLKDYYNLLY